MKPPQVAIQMFISFGVHGGVRTLIFLAWCYRYRTDKNGKDGDKKNGANESNGDDFDDDDDFDNDDAEETPTHAKAKSTHSKSKSDISTKDQRKGPSGQ